MQCLPGRLAPHLILNMEQLKMPSASEQCRQHNEKRSHVGISRSGRPNMAIVACSSQAASTQQQLTHNQLSNRFSQRSDEKHCVPIHGLPGPSKTRNACLSRRRQEMFVLVGRLPNLRRKRNDVLNTIGKMGSNNILQWAHVRSVCVCA